MGLGRGGLELYIILKERERQGRSEVLTRSTHHVPGHKAAYVFPSRPAAKPTNVTKDHRRRQIPPPGLHGAHLPGLLFLWVGGVVVCWTSL